MPGRSVSSQFFERLSGAAQRYDTFWRAAVLAILYYCAGRIGLLFAAPPGNATIFWPASGVAVAFCYLYGMRMLPGVFLGAWLMYVTPFLTGEAQSSGVLDWLGLPVYQSLGASAQAVLAAFLIWRSIGRDNHLESYAEIFSFSVLAGPVACLFSASFSCAMLYVLGIIKSDTFFITWAMWYVGDALGVLVFAPSLILLLSRDYSNRRRKWMVCLPLVVIFAAIMSLFFLIKGGDETMRHRELMADVRSIETDLDNKFYYFVDELKGLKALYDVSALVEEREFQIYVDHIFEADKNVSAIMWAPVVSSREASSFVSSSRSAGHPDYYIKEKGAEGVFVPVGERAEYYPVRFLRHASGLSRSMGFDLGSDEKRLSALIRARDSGFPTASEALEMITKLPGGGQGFMIFVPIYKHGVPIETVEQRRVAFEGVLAGSFQHSAIVDPVMREWKLKGLELRVEERDEKGREYFVYATDSFLRGDEQDHSQAYGSFASFIHESLIIFAGQLWDIDFYYRRDYALSHVNWSIWYFLGGALVLAFFAASFLLAVTGQTAVVQKIVNLRTRELSDRNAFLGLIMDHVPDMIFVKNRKLEIVSANRAMLETIDPQARDSFVGSTGFELYPDEDVKLYREQDEIAFSEGVSDVLEPYRDFAGNMRVIHTRKMAFRNNAGEEFLLGVAHDVTAEKAAEAELRRSNKELEDFAYVASHDLKAPLRHISISAGFLKERYKEVLDAKGREILEGMVSSTMRMQRMIESLLSYSRVGRTKKEFVSFDLSSALDNALKALYVPIREKSVIIDIVTDLPRVRGDSGLLSQLFQNLIQNSIKYSRNGVSPRIRIGARQQDRQWEIWVEDEGIGIQAEYAGKIFDIFQRLHADDAYEGVGIGLAICKRIVEFHGGRIWLDPGYGAGARFVFTLEAES